jgi:hypothetical protein
LRTQVLAAVVAGGALVGGCYRMAAEDKELEHGRALTGATRQKPLDVVGPRVDPRTRTGGEDVAGSIPDLAEGQAPLAVEPERNDPDQTAPAERGVGGSGWADESEGGD